MEGSLSPASVRREAIILAGGFGTRLRSAVPDLPKVLAPVAGRPFLAHILDFLDQNGFVRVILAVGYRYDDIVGAFSNQYKKITIEYSIEDQPLGTGGAVWKAARQATPGQNIFVFNGDTYAAVDFTAMEEAITKIEIDLSMAIRSMKDTGRYGLVGTDNSGIVTSFREKMPGHSGIINAGSYFLRHDLAHRFPFPGAFSLETDLLQARINDLRIASVPMNGYFIDIGIPEDYERANRELA